MTNPAVAVDRPYWNPMVPELSVTDLARSLAFYTGLLGFSVRYRRDDPPFAYLEQQQVQLMLEQVHLAGWQVGALFPQALRICNAGAIVMKMPMNSTATSMIGPKVNLLFSRSLGEVVK